MPEMIETYQLCASLLDLGANGGQPRDWLTAEHPGVRGCAALAPALADDPKARRVLAELCLAPRAFDQALGHGLDPASPALRHFAGPPRWRLIDVACARVYDFRSVVLGAWMALPRAFRIAPCPELSPYLRVVFPHGWPEGSAATSAQVNFASGFIKRDELWQTDDSARIRTLRTLGLPTDRAVWRELVNRPRQLSADDILALPGQMAVRMRPHLYLGEGVNRTHPGLLRRLFEKLLDAYEQAATDGEISGYRLTVESDARVMLAVDGAALSAQSRPTEWKTEFTHTFISPHLSHSGRTDAMAQLTITAAFCCTISAHTWYGGHGYAQHFADMVAVDPVQSTGPADGTGYRAVLELDTEWLPPGAAVPRGLDSRPAVTDLRTPA